MKPGGFYSKKSFAKLALSALYVNDTLRPALVVPYLEGNAHGGAIAFDGATAIAAGRISLENASFDLPLKKGENEILIGVANAFYGWGIIARLDDNKGLLLDK